MVIDFDRFSGKAQVRRDTLSCDSSYFRSFCYIFRCLKTTRETKIWVDIVTKSNAVQTLTETNKSPHSNPGRRISSCSFATPGPNITAVCVGRPRLHQARTSADPVVELLATVLSIPQPSEILNRTFAVKIKTIASFKIPNYKTAQSG